MQLQPLSSANVQLEGNQPSGARQVRTTVPDYAQFSAAESVDKALAAASEARPEMVERARQLTASAMYPPPVLIDGIAHLIADKLLQR
jgi:hypothetical protein